MIPGAFLLDMEAVMIYTKTLQLAKSNPSQGIMK